MSPDEVFEEFISEKEFCSICGNWGYIDSRHIKTPAGLCVGKLNYCICLNGREMKKVGWDIEREIKERFYDKNA